MKVVIAVIKNLNDQILITRRPFHVREGGKWEFPGGKVNLNELPSDALKRELQEELGISIDNAHFQMEIPGDRLQLMVYEVLSFRGVPRCCAGQLDMKWVASTLLETFSFPDRSF